MSDKTGRVEFYTDTAGKHRWRVVAANGRILADSGQGYRRRKDCEAGAALASRVIEQATQANYIAACP